jgi:hypothetical protein
MWHSLALQWLEKPYRNRLVRLEKSLQEPVGSLTVTSSSNCFGAFGMADY